MARHTRHRRSKRRHGSNPVALSKLFNIYKSRNANNSINANSRNSYYNSQATVGRAAPAIEIKTVQDAERLIKLFKEFSQILGIIHAKWCGHCTRMMPQYRQLVSQGNNSVPSFDVEESNLPMLNEALVKSGMKELSADAYPTANMYDSKASAIKSVSPDIKEVEKILNSPATPMSMTPVNTSGVVEPPLGTEDLKSVSENGPSPSVKVGGSLAAAISSTAYHLAPAAVLLATAAVTLKRCKKGRKGSKNIQKTRKNSNRSRRS